MSASRMISQLALRRSSVLKSSTSATVTRLPSAARSHSLRTFTCPAAIPALRQYGRLLSNPHSQLRSAQRWFASTSSLSSAVSDAEGSSGARGMKVAIIGQSLFGKEVELSHTMYIWIHNTCMYPQHFNVYSGSVATLYMYVYVYIVYAYTVVALFL